MRSRHLAHIGHQEIARTPRPPFQYETDSSDITDAMARRVEVGDVITWKSGGYFSNFMSFGLVLRINDDLGSIRVLNHNSNKITIWRTYNVIILARSNNYDLIPDRYRRNFGI